MGSHQNNNVSTVQWVSWIIGAAAGSFALMSYAYGKFETKESAIDRKISLETQIHALDQKLDVIIDLVGNRKR